MASVLDILSQQLGGGAVESMSRQLGADKSAVESAIPAALAVLTGAMAKNASRSNGARSLAGALERDHDGSILDNLGGLLSNPEGANGAGILKHVLGGRRSTAESAISQTTGLDSESVSKLLMMLAPLVMGALGKVKRERELGADDLASVLAGERRRAETSAPGLGGLLGGLLDSDGDGDFKDDVARMGAGFLGKLFGGKR